jgi:hypothetical protein
MTNEEKDQLMKVLSVKSDELRINEAELRETLQQYQTLKIAFIQLLAEYTSIVERRNLADPNEIEYKYMDLSGLLDI